jgi:Acyl-CoA carboxylase epsilon subunit
MAGSGSGSAGRPGEGSVGRQGEGSARRPGEGSVGRQGEGSAGRQGEGLAGAGRPGAPLLAVVRGDASAEEIAALTAVLAAKSAAAARAAAASSAADRGRRAFGWASRRAMLRKPLSHGPGAWRASARPGAGT